MPSAYDAVVVGATPAGAAAAVRAARSGRETCLVAVNEHLGGMMAGGLSYTDTLLAPEKGRAPLVDEFFERIRGYYRETYGEESTQYEACNGGMFFEPHVAESTFESLVDEPSLTVLKGRYPTSVERTGRLVRTVIVDSPDGGASERIAGRTFVDATYEGDLAAAAGVPYRVGRESREEYGERFAGRVFTDAGDVSSIRPGSTGKGDDAVQAYNYRLCLSRDPDNRRRPERPDGYDRREYLWVLYGVAEMEEHLESNGVDDGMAVGLRSRRSEALAEAMARWRGTDGPPTVDDGDRWVPLSVDPYRGADPVETEPIPCPAMTSLTYRSGEELLGLFGRGDFEWGRLPNDKHDLNTCDLVGESNAYPEADRDEREEIARRHREYVLGFLYFLQNDEEVPEELRREARSWGLARDEFEGDDNFPWQLYVREARRIEGRETFTESDALLAEGVERAPVNGTAVAVAEYPLDPHDVRPVRRTGTAADGRFFLTELTVPSQIPYGALVPDGVDNLLVPVALSASHVGFQTVRLEPTWMQLGEAAGAATAAALDRGTTPRRLPTEALQRRLAESGSTLSFFADVGVGVDADEPWVAAVQYLGTKGFFDSYEARPREPLSRATADAWLDAAETLARGDDVDPTERARAVAAAGDEPGSVAANRFAERLGDAVDGAEAGGAERLENHPFEPDRRLSRGDACRLVYDALADGG